jgi:hypothetical protein
VGFPSEDKAILKVESHLKVIIINPKLQKFITIVIKDAIP